MQEPEADRQSSSALHHTLRNLVSPRHLWKLVAIAILLYIGVAYLLMPGAWGEYERLHPALKNAPGVTHTTVGIPADPINVALIGSKKEMLPRCWRRSGIRLIL